MTKKTKTEMMTAGFPNNLMEILPSHWLSFSYTSHIRRGTIFVLFQHILLKQKDRRIFVCLYDEFLILT